MRLTQIVEALLFASDAPLSAGDIALMLIESNHDLRAARILLGRLNGKMDRLTNIEADELELLAGNPSLRASATRRRRRPREDM